MFARGSQKAVPRWHSLFPAANAKCYVDSSSPSLTRTSDAASVVKQSRRKSDEE